MAQEQQSSDVDKAVYAARLTANLVTGNFGRAAFEAVTNPEQTIGIIKYALIVIAFIILVPLLIATSIPTSILSLVSTDTTTSSETKAFSSQYDNFYNAFEEVLNDSISNNSDISGKIDVNICLLISYFSAWSEKQTPEIESKSQLKIFKEKIKAANLISIKKGKNKVTVSYKGDVAFAKYLNLTQNEMEMSKAKSGVLATIINKKEVVSFDLSELADNSEDFGAAYGGGKIYKLSNADYEFLCKIIAQECSESYEGSLAVISQMCNMCEYSTGGYKGKTLIYAATHGWYSSYTSGAYKNRHPASFVKKAVKDALNGKRNLPPYVQDFWQAGYKPHNYGYSEGKRFYKTIGDNDYFYYIQDKQRLKKATAAYEKAGSVGPIVYYNQGDYNHRFSGPGGTNTIKSAGCGPTSLAICISTLTGRRVTPIQVADWGAKQGLYIQGEGWSHSCPGIMANHWGLKCKKIARSKKNLKTVLRKGQLVVAVMGPGHFTSGGHYIVLYGLNSKGQILVSDCGSRSRNGAWNFDIVFNETKDGYWQIYK
jgi:hypothetical protein